MGSAAAESSKRIHSIGIASYSLLWPKHPVATLGRFDIHSSFRVDSRFIAELAICSTKRPVPRRTNKGRSVNDPWPARAVTDPHHATLLVSHIPSAARATALAGVETPCPFVFPVLSAV